MNGVPSKSIRKRQNKTTRTKFISTKEGLMAALVVKEFLEYFNLEFSTSIYKKEMMQDQEHKDGSREQLIASLDFDENDVEGPLVLELLKLSKMFRKKDTRRNNSELNLTPQTKSYIKPEPLCSDPLEHQNQNIIVPQMHQDAAEETLIEDTIEFEQDPLCPDGTVKEEDNVKDDQHYEPIPPIFDNKHVSEVSGEEMKCEMCQSTFKRIHFLRRHIAIVHSGGSADEQLSKLKKNAMRRPDGIVNEEDNDGFVNEEDNVELDPDYNVDKHVSDVSDEEIKCEACEVTFARIDSLRRHIAVIHSGSVNEQPKQSYKLKKKGMRSSQKSEAKHECDICHAKFSRQKSLSSHIDIVHKGNPPFKCEHCGKGFSCKTHKKDHVESLHLKIRNFQCDFCSYSSYDIKYMKQHVFARHQNSTIAKCNHCNLTFKGQAVLYRHKLECHVGKTFPCDFCGKVLSDKCSLKHHIQSHHKHQHAQSDFGDGTDEME